MIFHLIFIEHASFSRLLAIFVDIISHCHPIIPVNAVSSISVWEKSKTGTMTNQANISKELAKPDSNVGLSQFQVYSFPLYHPVLSVFWQSALHFFKYLNKLTIQRKYFDNLVKCKNNARAWFVGSISMVFLWRAQSMSHAAGCLTWDGPTERRQKDRTVAAAWAEW